MEGPSSMLLISILSLLLPHSLSSTVVIDEVTNLRDPTAHIGDSIIFKHKDEYKLYIFQNRGDFKLCNFTRATLLTKPNSTSFTWHPSRLGFFYFSFNNGSSKPCQEGQKLTIKVSPLPASLLKDSTAPPELSPLAPPVSFSGGIVTSSPAYPWPFLPRESQSPSPTQTMFLPLGPTFAPDLGVPFINSNPVVPFPSGEVDSATILPVPTSQGQVVVAFFAAQMALRFVTFVLLH